MSKSLRMSEKWFRRGLWLLSFIFAAFLIGLGGLVVDDLPKVERPVERDMYVDASKAEPLQDQLGEVARKVQELEDNEQSLALDAENAASEYSRAHETFNNWLASRSVTQQQAQDPEVLARTKALDVLKGKQVEVDRKLADSRRTKLNLTRERDSIQEKLDHVRGSANGKWVHEARRQELRVFIYRLLLTLPLILIAGWLFVKKRKGSYWPFVWGFIFFALYAFFVELVPYLPSYGGYVRYVVGIFVTMAVGHYGIKSMQRYLARQQAQEAEPDRQRRQGLAYDLVLARLSKKICPGCERPVDLEKPEVNHCPHCGISIFTKCEQCQARKNAFSPFCYSCGTANKVQNT